MKARFSFFRKNYMRESFTSHINPEESSRQYAVIHEGVISNETDEVQKPSSQQVQDFFWQNAKHVVNQENEMVQCGEIAELATVLFKRNDRIPLNVEIEKAYFIRIAEILREAFITNDSVHLNTSNADNAPYHIVGGEMRSLKVNFADRMRLFRIDCKVALKETADTTEMKMTLGLSSP